MKNKKTKVGSFAIAKLQAKMRSILTILAIALVFAMTACKEEGGGNATVSGEIIGTWKSTYHGSTIYVNVTATTWEISGLDSGYFTAWNDNTATIYGNSAKGIVGTVTLKTPTTATVVLNKLSTYPGTYECIKVEGGNNGIVSGAVEGGDNVIVSGAPVTYDIKYFESDVYMTEAKNETNFSYSYNTAYTSGSSSVTVSGGKVTIKLGTPHYLEDDFSLWIELGLTVSNKNANGFSQGGFSTSDKNYYLYCIKDDDNIAFLEYVDRDVTITGTYSYSGYTDNWDVSLKKGWNYEIVSYNGATKTWTYTSSTTQPSGFNWTVIDKWTVDKINVLKLRLD